MNLTEATNYFLETEDDTITSLFHRTTSDAAKSILTYGFDKDRLGTGLFGFGIYCSPDPESLGSDPTYIEEYGDTLLELNVDLKDFISFNPDFTDIIYGKELSPIDQLKDIMKEQITNVPGGLIEYLKDFKYFKQDKDGNNYATIVWEDYIQSSPLLKSMIKGMVYENESDGGTAIVIYDTSSIKDVRMFIR